VADGGRITAAHNFWAESQMQFVDDSGAEESVVEFSAAFAQQAFHFPFLLKRAEGKAKIQLAPPANDDVIGQAAQLIEPARAGGFGGENDDGRKPFLKNGGF